MITQIIKTDYTDGAVHKHLRLTLISAIVTVLFSTINYLPLTAEAGTMETIKELEKEQAQPTPVTPAPQVVVRQSVTYRAVKFRDPFQSYSQESSSSAEPTETIDASVTPPSLTLQGVILGGKFSQAIINNKVVKVGDWIGEAQVTSIDKSGVTVLFKNKSYTFAAPTAANK